MKEKIKNVVIVLFAFLAAFCGLFLPGNADKVEAAPKLSDKKIWLDIEEKYPLKVKGTDKTVTWLSSDARVAAVDSKGKVTGRTVGSAVVSAKVGKKTLKCKVKVDVYFWEPSVTENAADTQTAAAADDEWLSDVSGMVIQDAPGIGKLKAYMKENAQFAEEINKYGMTYREEGVTSLITYDLTEDVIDCTVQFTTENPVTTAYFLMSIAKINGEMYASYRISDENGIEMQAGTTSFDPASYKKDSEVYFLDEVYSRYTLDEETGEVVEVVNDTLDSLANEAMKKSLAVLEKQVAPAGITLKDLFFTAYEG